MQNIQRPGVGRRAVVRTAAWTAPAVAVVAAAPAYAATGAPDLSTSVAGTPTRTIDAGTGFATFTIPEDTTVFNNTGGDALGLTAVVSFVASGGAGVRAAAVATNVTDVQIAGQPYTDFVGVVDVVGLGTSSVTLNISDVFTITAGSSMPLPLALAFITDNTGTATTMSVSVTAANGGVGTSFAPVDFAAAAPNLSTSTASAPTRAVFTPPTIVNSRVEPGKGDAYTYAAGAISVVNTGDSAAQGLTLTASTSTGAIQQVLLGGTPLAAAASTASGIGTSQVTIDVPASEVTVAGGATHALSSLEIVTDNLGDATTITVTVAAMNGGTSKNFDPSAFAAASVAGPNLSTTTGGTFTSTNATTKTGAATTFRNSGNENAVGILTIIETDYTLTDIRSSGFSITNGITGINMLGTGFPSKVIHMRVPGGGLAAMTINAGGTKNSPSQTFHLASPGGQITIKTLTFGLVNGQPKGIPLKSTVTVA